METSKVVSLLHPLYVITYLNLALILLQDEGEYTVNVTFCGVDVPKAPFKVKIYNDGPRNKVDPKKVKVEGPGLTGDMILPDENAWFKINYLEAGPAEPKVEIVGPDR